MDYVLSSILMKDSSGLGYNEKVRRKCEELYADGCRTNHLLACIIDICQERAISEESEESLFHINNALKVLFYFIFLYVRISIHNIIMY